MPGFTEQYLKDLGVQVVTTAASGTEFRCMCINTACDDRSGHLYVNALTGKYFCHKCGTKGVLTRERFRKVFDSIKDKLTLDSLTKDDIAESLEIYNKAYAIEYPPRIPAIEPALEYLLNRRKFTLDEIYKYKLRVSLFGKYAYRILIPFFIGGEFKGFTARSYIETEKIRYLNSKGNTTSLLYNIDSLLEDPSKVPVLVEGPLDAITISALSSFTGIASLGKQFNEKQFVLLHQLWDNLNFKKLIYLPDYDVTYKEIQAFTRELTLVLPPNTLYITRLPKGKDANSCDKQTLSLALTQALPIKKAIKLFL